MSVALVQSTAALIERGSMTRDQVDLLKRTYAKGTTDDEFALFIATANRLGLDVFAKQIHAVKRYSRKDNREVMSIQVGIDGYRATASRTGEDDGQDDPQWCGPDGKWTDIWLDEKNPPMGARVRVWRKGRSRPYTGVVSYASYVQCNADGKPNAMWSRGPDFMLAKCAEAVALRKAFPAELSGTVTPEEIGTEEPEIVESRLAPLPAVTAKALAPAAQPALNLEQKADLSTVAAAIESKPFPKDAPIEAQREHALGVIAELDAKREDATANGGKPAGAQTVPDDILAAEGREVKMEKYGDDLDKAATRIELTKIAVKIDGEKFDDATKTALRLRYKARDSFLVEQAGGAK